MKRRGLEGGSCIMEDMKSGMPHLYEKAWLELWKIKTR